MGLWKIIIFILATKNVMIKYFPDTLRLKTIIVKSKDNFDFQKCDLKSKANKYFTLQ